MLPPHWKRCRGCGLTQALVVKGLCLACAVRSPGMSDEQRRWLLKAGPKAEGDRKGNPDGWYLSRTGHWERRKKDV